MEVTQADAEETARRLAREEGIFGGVSAGGIYNEGNLTLLRTRVSNNQAALFRFQPPVSAVKDGVALTAVPYFIRL